MTRLSNFFVSLLSVSFRSRLSLQLEVAALRHQLSLYQRHRKKPQIEDSDRFLWSIIAKLWGAWRQALFFVQPRTVVAWQRRRFRDYWRSLSQRCRVGRPPISPKLRELIQRMWRANPTWGSPRIVGELHKLGINVVKSTVEKYKPPREGPPSQTWKTFLDQHLKELVSVDCIIITCEKLHEYSGPTGHDICLYRE